MIPCNAIKKTNPRNSKGSGCQKGHRIQTDINWRICWKNIFVYYKNQRHSYGCTYKKLKKKISCFLFHFTLPICFFLICNCSEPSKISKNRYKMLAFLRLFLKFYLADTPHRRNAQHFGGWLWTVTLIYSIFSVSFLFLLIPFSILYT